MAGLPLEANQVFPVFHQVLLEAGWFFFDYDGPGHHFRVLLNKDDAGQSGRYVR